MFVADPDITGRMNLADEASSVTDEQLVKLMALARKHDRVVPEDLTEREAARLIEELQQG